MTSLEHLIAIPLTIFAAVSVATLIAVTAMIAWLAASTVFWLTIGAAQNLVRQAGKAGGR